MYISVCVIVLATNLLLVDVCCFVAGLRLCAQLGRVWHVNSAPGSGHFAGPLDPTWESQLKSGCEPTKIRRKSTRIGGFTRKTGGTIG